MGKWVLSKERALQRAIDVLKVGRIYPEADDMLVVAKLEELRRSLVRANNRAKTYNTNKKEKN